MTWAHYILQVNIYLVVFYGFYKLLLDKETYFLLNRIYLVSAGIFSLAIPFIRLEWFSTQPAVQPVYTGAVQINDFITQMAVVQDDPERFNLGNTLVFIYLTGILFFVIRFIVQLISVQVLLKAKKSGSAFSFFKKKVVDQDLPEVQTIQKHEEIHIRQWHTLDVLFFELLGIITWFNPIIYFYKTTVKHIHEYLADEEAANFQGDKEEYALLLLSRAFKVPTNTLTNSFFNKSLIKKRIYMLHKQRSRKTAILKYGMFVPLFAIALIMSSATIRNNEEIKKVAEEIPMEEPLKLVQEAIKTTIAAPFVSDSKSLINEAKKELLTSNTAGIDSSWNEFYKYLKKSVRYPVNAQNSNIQGVSQIKFTVKNGAIEGVSVATKALGGGCDAEVMRAILTYPGFKANNDGKYSLPFSFALMGSENTTTSNKVKPAVVSGYSQLSELSIFGYKPKTTDKNESLSEVVIRAGEETANAQSGKVYDFVSLEAQPTFPGGMDQFYEYLKRSVRYPKEAFENKVEGKVFLSFVVETDGSLTDIKVDRKLGSGTDEEAVRVLEESPKWNPGVQDGHKVRVKYNIPISFSLNKTTLNLQGKVQGIQIIDNKLEVSDSNLKPLYFVDGEKVEGLKLSSINPNDIASIEVLKSKTATEIYGEEAKDGVIKITTKAKQTPDLKKKETNEKVYDFVSTTTQPSFPGGMKKFYDFLKKTVRYPKEAQEKNIQGKVFVSMIVETDGSLTDIKVDRKLGGGTDEEAVRVLKASPKWTPGTQGGKKVRVKYNIPISFTLSK
ncbi:M56 family metallopeptidase [Pedobacter foliorum]|uniref:M56 family metallopeptidase n=1 Tax=Pedobacter foliorum TaxID=2739058 RepID=UPI001FE47EE8|nr:M56 family metallopeptidase [Pedobacter foliorum]